MLHSIDSYDVGIEIISNKRVDDIIYVWPQIDYITANWDIIEEYEKLHIRNEFIKRNSYTTHIKAHTQDIMENATDFNHMNIIHQLPLICGTNPKLTFFAKVAIKIIRIDYENIEKLRTIENSEIITFSYMMKIMIFSKRCILNFHVKFYLIGNQTAIIYYGNKTWKFLLRITIFTNNLLAQTVNFDIFSNSASSFFEYILIGIITKYIKKFISTNVSQFHHGMKT